MKESRARLNDYEWLSIVPAGGLGTRLGKLTEKRAKPSLAVAFDEAGEITRMIDIPLGAIRGIGGAAIVSRCFAPETLDFIDGYDHVETVSSRPEDSPIDTLLANLDIIENSRAAHVGLIPGDTNISGLVLEEIRTVLDRSGADAVLLGTRHFEGHNIRPVDGKGMMCAPEDGVDRIGDMGVHMFQREWLLTRLHECLADNPTRQREVWNDIYNVPRPKGKVYLHVPDRDLIDVDMGTLPAFRKVVEELNVRHRDVSGNIVFPGAELHPASVGCLALPGSVSLSALKRAIVPEGVTVATPDDYLEI